MPRLVFTVALACFLPVLAGCGGPKLVPVTGAVTLDGKPVDGATVTFVSEDGKNSFSGSTDASGKYSLQEGEKVGALPGSYKVIVVKNPHKASSEAIDPAESMKMMKKEEEETHKASKAATGGAGSDPKSKMMKSVAAAAAAPAPLKTDLPTTYANSASTPLTAKVEKGEGTTVNLELKSK